MIRLPLHWQQPIKFATQYGKDSDIDAFTPEPSDAAQPGETLDGSWPMAGPKTSLFIACWSMTMDVEPRSH
jgi:hypothetical protein